MIDSIIQLNEASNKIRAENWIYKAQRCDTFGNNILNDNPTNYDVYIDTKSRQEQVVYSKLHDIISLSV